MTQIPDVPAPLERPFPIPSLERPPLFTLHPNEHLETWINAHRTSDIRDPLPAFTETQHASKASSLYNMHTYWSKKPHEAIESYIRHYTGRGDVVLDPFSGSGGTAVAALMNGRKAVALDLSPAAAFISYHYTHPVDPRKLEAAYTRLMTRVAPELEWLYATTLGEQPARTGYTVYSGALECPDCKNPIVIFHAPTLKLAKRDRAGNPVRKAGLEQFEERQSCRECGFTFTTRELSKYKKLPPVPVKVSVLDSRGKRSEREPNDDDLAKLEQIEKGHIPHWTPKAKFPRGERYYKDGLAWRGIETLKDLYSKRNLWALSALLEGIGQEEDLELRSKLLFVLSAILFNCTTMYRNRDKGGVQMGTYYIPSDYREINVSQSYKSKMGDVLSALRSSKPFALSEIIISRQTSTDLSGIPSSSVDYIFTDPPYAGKVQYGELNFVWEAWLNLPTDWHDGEIIENKTRGLDLGVWAARLEAAMLEVFRVLKPGRWCTLTYHDTESVTWELLHTLMNRVGFVPDDADRVVSIDTEQKSYNQRMTDKNAQTDLVINFYKPRFAGDLPPSVNLSGRDLSTSGKTLEGRVSEVIVGHLSEHPGQTKAQLYDAVISRMVRSSEMQAFHLESVLDLMRGSLWQVDDRYYLRGQEIPDIDAALFGWEGLRDDQPELKAVGFLYTLLSKHPLDYSSLLAEFNTSRSLAVVRGILNGRGKTLESLLESGFVYEETQRVWRRPNPQEQKDLAVERHRRLEREFKKWLTEARVHSTPTAPDLETVLWALEQQYAADDYASLLETITLVRRAGELPEVLEDYALIAEAGA